MRLVLVGGGLSHLTFIRKFAKYSSFEHDIILVNNESHVIFEPLLNDVVKGDIPLAAASIDLRKICMLSGVNYIQAEVEGLDLEKKLIKFADRASLQFDLISVDSVQDQSEGAEHLFFINNLTAFMKKLHEFRAAVEKVRPNPLNVAVLGDDENAINLSLILAPLLRPFSPKLKWEIFTSHSTLLPHYTGQIRRHLEKTLKKNDILFHTDYDVVDRNSNVLKDKNSKEIFDADVVFVSSAIKTPNWLLSSGLPVNSQGFVEIHPHFVVKNFPQALASPGISRDRWTDSVAMAENLNAMISGKEPQRKVYSSVFKKGEYMLPDQQMLTSRLGLPHLSQKKWQERNIILRDRADELRGVREQKMAHLQPLIEDSGFVDLLKQRLEFDIDKEILKSIFLENLNTACRFDGWLEKEYRDVFNDHYLSGYHTGLDMMDMGYSAAGEPQFLRLYTSAPSNMKDVEILSQIIIGAHRACKDRMELRLHICSQAMNAVQFSLGYLSHEKSKFIAPQKMYLALTRPLGLYGLLSQQGKDVWEGQWINDVWSKINQPQNYLSAFLQQYGRDVAVQNISDDGLVNGIVHQLGSEGWKFYLNLRRLPRWPGVDQLLKTNPKDPLILRNWKKGFRFWSGQGETIPESQYLLWEPHLVRGPSCLFINPAVAAELAETLKEDFGVELTFIGFAEATQAQEQTQYKLSDWEL